MQHLVNVSLAPVIVIMDDQGNSIQTFVVGPASWLLHLPGLLCTILPGLWPIISCLLSAICHLLSAICYLLAFVYYLPTALFGRGWPADLVDIAEAAWLLFTGRWLFLEPNYST
jgi:hypothetical protein